MSTKRPIRIDPGSEAPPVTSIQQTPRYDVINQRGVQYHSAFHVHLSSLQQRDNRSLQSRYHA
jgi:hypothetical protein